MTRASVFFDKVKSQIISHLFLASFDESNSVFQIFYNVLLHTMYYYMQGCSPCGAEIRGDGLEVCVCRQFNHHKVPSLACQGHDGTNL